MGRGKQWSTATVLQVKTLINIGLPLPRIATQTGVVLQTLRRFSARVKKGYTGDKWSESHAYSVSLLLQCKSHPCRHAHRAGCRRVRRRKSVLHLIIRVREHVSWVAGVRVEIITVDVHTTTSLNSAR